MAKKLILIILGVLLGLCGIGALCGGGALLGLGGASGHLQSDFHNISTSSVGFVSDPARVKNSSNVNVSGGPITLRLDGRNSSKPLFFGVGPTAQVNSYLAGAPYESVTNVDFSPFRMTTSRVDGNARPAAPGDQSFWVAQATGTSPHLSWKIASGDYELVVMNQDASPQVTLDARVGVKAPVLGWIGLFLLIGGVVAVLVGLALLIWGIRTSRAPTVAPATGYPYPGGTPYSPTGTYPEPSPYTYPEAPYPPTNQYPPDSAPPSSGRQPDPPDDPTAPPHA